MESGRCHTKKIPFRFLAAWETHPDWTSFVDRQWDKRKKFSEALSLFKGKAKEWNYNQFGNINKCKARVIARIGGLQRAFETHSTPNLRKLESELKQKYVNILIQEDLL